MKSSHFHDTKQAASAVGARIDYDGDGRAEDVLRWALNTFHPRIAIACSFQHAVLIDLAIRIRPDVRVFSIDTGRLPEETYECARDIERHFGIRIEWYFPRHDALEKLVREKGSFSFKESLAARRECCGIRKVEPLNRALSDLDAWITGVRRDQNVTRANADKIEIDSAHGGIVKINPLADWTDEQIKAYAKTRCLRRATGPSDAPAAHELSKQRKTHAPDDGGGRTRTTRNAVCM
jgi:phosphoadenosine phosphosulfate reductase